MDVSVTLWTFKEILDKLPFDSPAEGPVDLDFAEIAAPYYIKHTFKASLEYEYSLPYEASYAVYSPKNIITVPIIMRQDYEDAFRAWLSGDRTSDVLEKCCLRKELYCHEACHLIAIIRAYPSERTAMARDDFLEKIDTKFKESLNTASLGAELSGTSPSSFEKEHFRYGNDSLNYFKLYQELMFPYDKMIEIIDPLVEKYKKTKIVTFDDVAEAAFVSKSFFDIFPDKLTAFQKPLAEKLFK